MNRVQYASGSVSLLLPKLHKLPCSSEQHWMGTLGNLGSQKEIQSQSVGSYFGTLCTATITRAIHNALNCVEMCYIRTYYYYYYYFIITPNLNEN